MFLLSHMLTAVLGLHLRELLLFPTAGRLYGIDVCQSGGSQRGRQDPTAGRSQSGYPKTGTTLLGVHICLPWKLDAVLHMNRLQFHVIIGFLIQWCPQIY